MATSFDDLGFARAYVLEIGSSLATKAETQEVHFEGNAKDDLLLVRVSPQGGAPWVGHFAPERPGLLVGVYATPNPRHLLVSSGIDAYLIPVDEPIKAELLPCCPVTVVSRPVGTDIVALGSFTDLTGIDAAGLLWRRRGCSSMTSRWWAGHLVRSRFAALLASRATRRI